MNDQVAIVTGGGGSIGGGICSALADKGVKVVINYLHSEEAAKNLAEKIRGSGGDAIAHACDVTQSESVTSMVRSTLEYYGRLDVLVNNAGIAHANFIIDMPESEWDQVLDTNLKSVFLCSRAVLPTFVEQRSGKIINIASMVARMGSYKYAHYAASKAGMIALTQSLAKEVGQYGICVNAISPGRIASTMEADRQRSQRAKWIADTPLARIGEPREIGNVVAFLCSERASFITGEVINVNGGLWMG